MQSGLHIEFGSWLSPLTYEAHTNVANSRLLYAKWQALLESIEVVYDAETDRMHRIQGRSQVIEEEVNRLFEDERQTVMNFEKYGEHKEAFTKTLQ